MLMQITFYIGGVLSCSSGDFGGRGPKFGNPCVSGHLKTLRSQALKPLGAGDSYSTGNIFLLCVKNIFATFMPSASSTVCGKDGRVQSSRGVCNLQESCDDFRVCWIKSQSVHLHCQVSRFPAPDPETHQSRQK